MTGVMMSLTNNIVNLPKPLMYLDANDTSSYSGTGTTVTDLSGNGYNSSLSSSGIYTVLNGVKCFDCTTTGQVTIGGTVPTLPTTGFTYISWARVISSSAAYRTLFRTTPSDHPLTISIGTNTLGMFDNDGAAFVSSTYDMGNLATTWVQWAVTGTNSAQTFYINGQQVGVSVAYGAGGNNHNSWGNWQNNQPFGYVANMYIYNKILTQSQLQLSYNQTKSRFGLLIATTVGTTTWVAPPGVTSVTYLVVGGGGGGGNAYDNSGGGGGGAGMVLTGTIDVTPGSSYTVTVGDGGAGGAGTYPGSYNGSAGSNSVFGSITALGGGLGYGCRANQAATGAAQVGSSTAPTGGGGGPGGGGGNGGGGSNGAGVAHSSTTGGNGGSGTSSSITGTSVSYGVGGKGGNSGSNVVGTAGTSNTGNGGGGAGATSSSGVNGGKGGSGIVVLVY